MDVLALLAERLPDGAVSTHPGELTSRSHDAWPLAMLREARGERLPRPMAVVFPRSTDDVAATLAWAAETRTPVVPRGAGSGVCGGAQAVWRGIVLDVSRMDRVVGIDEESLAVEVEAGIRGDRVESQLNKRQLTLGHYPQSLAISSIGGWIASGSAGQASARYGSIEDLILGLTAVLAGGHVLRLRSTPRSAAGPDLRTLLTGSEGTLAVVTRATLSVARLPEERRWLAYGLAGFAEGITVAREVIQRGCQPTILRLYDQADALVTFGSLGHDSGAVLLLGFDSPSSLEGSVKAADEVASSAGAEPRPETYGEHWWEHRNDAVETYRRIMGEERQLGSGVIVDTMEVAGLWRRLPSLYQAVWEALFRHASQAVACHVSHAYRSGASLEFTFLVHADDDEKAERAYARGWADAARACHRAGGTMTHHSGVGMLKAPFLEKELGTVGLNVLRRVKEAMDPTGILNPGKLLPPEE
ncbi:MAG TPA: FAD-binding oxidoreductase [Actinomycetota bacterium]|nr:FAD-binding oxidoreductase [Actinomycetota bacterium]